MSSNKTHVIDKTGWASGPWDNEPDREDFRYKGVPCLILRNGVGALCGYAGVDSSHPLYEISENDACLSAHGGITYAGHCSEPICHVPLEGETDDIWWFGFDTAHYQDIVPDFTKFMPFTNAELGQSYKDMAYVRKEIEKLVDQLLKVATETTPEAMRLLIASHKDW